MATAERGEMLKRAIQSVRDSSKNSISIVAIINGNKHDDELCIWLSKQHDVIVETIALPSAPNAISKGRELVCTKYFSTLDDDDEYLPGSTDRKLIALKSSPKADLVIGNCFNCVSGADEMRFRKLAEVEKNPFEILMSFNWLTSNNSLYRTSSIEKKYFENYADYAEWTWLAFKLMMDDKQLLVIDEPLARCHVDTPNSLSKSKAYEQFYIYLFNRMLATSPPFNIRIAISKKMAAAYHCASEVELTEGRIFNAWKNHFLSLKHSGGFKYINYTRHLIAKKFYNWY